ncbi:hypothetical protein SBOR_8236 [Sclerotinia borealis F-4128]|uniref:Yippee domain-containing protein n=1 Tax=Sclerotinia borealis (strain F-4128) TaxID=1432307 RepID=W9C948_SCLBF|nr:hypothetical protein SBOR_8236 [Sclerotinia borealis F-4128]
MSNERLTFPTYLIPSFSFPFRRRQTSTSSSTAASLNTNTSASIPGLSHSPTSSYSNTPIASPTFEHFPTHTYSSSSATETKTKHNESTYPLCPSSRSRTSPEPQASSPPQAHLTRPHPSTIRCLTCSTHLSYTSQIVSKGFTGRHGRAYLVAPPPPTPVPIIPPFPPTAHDRSKNLSNIRIGRAVNRELLTGHHVVADVNCAVCNTLLGWKYVDAREAGQRYKIGKFILETKRVVVVHTYEDEDVVPHSWDYKCGDGGGGCEGMMGGGGVGGVGAVGRVGRGGDARGLEVETKEEEEASGWVHFDSEDEDECEELFAGTWDAEVIQRRRIRRVDRRKKERERERERERVASQDSGVGGL